MRNIPTHTPVPDADYFALLPPAGLVLADQILQEDYERLAQAQMPVADTVSGLLVINSLQSQEVRP